MLDEDIINRPYKLWALSSICDRFKLKNIEETEAAKKLLQEKRFVGRSKSEFSIPSSYSADYFHRGRDYAEKLRRGASSLYIVLPFDTTFLSC